MNSPIRDWWAVQVRAGREQVAALHLRLRGYDVFVPCYLVCRQWSDRIKKIERPLFAGYLFCHVTRAKVGKVITAPGVIRILGDTRGPLPIPHAEIDAIQRIIETRLAVTPCPFIKVGQKVRVEVGPLRGLDGIVLGTKGRRRLIVSVPLLQRSAAVELDADWISMPGSDLLGDAAGGPSAQPDGCLPGVLDG